MTLVNKLTPLCLSTSICRIPVVSSLHTSAVLQGAPLKKKARIDPELVRLQTDRRRRKLEKALRKAKATGQKLKPVDEFELYRTAVKDAPPRTVETMNHKEVKSRHKATVKEWGGYQKRKMINLHRKIEDMLISQEMALSQLKLENLDLYEKAVKSIDNLLPLTFTGPSETPPIHGYIQDGEYIETTRTYEMDENIVKTMLEVNQKRELDEEVAKKLAKKQAKKEAKLAETKKDDD